VAGVPLPAVIGRAVGGAESAVFAGTVADALGSAGAGPVEIGGCFEQAEPSPRRSDRIKRLFIRRLPNCEAKQSHEEQAARRGPRPLSQSRSPNLRSCGGW